MYCLYAVAESGMRQMMEPRINEVMTYIDSLMSNTDINPFRYNLMNGSRVLSGEEEAILSWISVNYLLGNFAGTYKFHSCRNNFHSTNVESAIRIGFIY